MNTENKKEKCITPKIVCKLHSNAHEEIYFWDSHLSWTWVYPQEVQITESFADGFKINMFNSDMRAEIVKGN